jgi:hypothetical protein
MFQIAETETFEEELKALRLQQRFDKAKKTIYSMLNKFYALRRCGAVAPRVLGSSRQRSRTARTPGGVFSRAAASRYRPHFDLLRRHSKSKRQRKINVV